VTLDLLPLRERAGLLGREASEVLALAFLPLGLARLRLLAEAPLLGVAGLDRELRPGAALGVVPAAGGSTEAFLALPPLALGVASCEANTILSSSSSSETAGAFFLPLVAGTLSCSSSDSMVDSSDTTG
jgi:hypothetical protein